MRIYSPRTIRGQLMGGLILFEVIVLALLAFLMAQEQHKELISRTDQRLEYESDSLVRQSRLAFEDRQLASLDRIVEGMRTAPGISFVQITDPHGNTLFSTGLVRKGAVSLNVQELALLGHVSKPFVFWVDKRTREAVAPVTIHGEVQALVWIYADDSRDRQQLNDLLRVTLFSAVFGLVVCTVFASLMARAIARPLGALIAAARQLTRNPENTQSFPIPITSANEAADLTIAFNLMVASISEQRAGLNDTLALLDSMLANAPIGFAFFDRRLRMVRVNQFLARMNEVPVSRHLGKTVDEVFAPASAHKLQAGIEQVFKDGYAVRDLEIASDEAVHGVVEQPAQGPNEVRNWLANIYPVRTDAQTVRWVGMILVETTERRRAEAMLRKSEKLAATGRLAASIAHEINNPLEAVTNLLYLIRHGELDRESLQYAEMAQDEVARMSEITQQMLRFYRQSTKPGLSNVSGLLDSVMALHERRAANLQIDVVRSYESELQLFCFAGEMRQLLNNLIANAIDAMTPGGGRLRLRVERVQHHPLSGLAGVRITVADTGSGMSRETRRHIFEPFFTTKEDTGTGLGLWVSAEIIQKHKGSIAIRSRLRNEQGIGGGTIFSLFFPADLKNMLQADAAELESTEAI
jgi:signal transduction histidine kinase